MAIIRGTTPTITFTFSDVLTSDMSKAIMTVTQIGRIIIERDMASAEVRENTLSWKLTQDETLRLTTGRTCEITCDWLLNDGTRGRSLIKIESVEKTGKNEVI